MLSLKVAEQIQPAEMLQGSWWIGWIAIAVLPLPVLICRNLLPAWAFMWVLCFAIFLSLKWLTWWRARARVAHTAYRSVAYLLAWPGMDASTFLDASQRVAPPLPVTWLRAALRTALGGIFLWVVPRTLEPSEPLLRGWLGMVGLILLLHFGTFEILTLLWQSRGVNARPIMSAPLRSSSLGEFWGRRWNLGFRQLAHELIFRRLNRSFGATTASLFVFLVSGLIHDLVISMPARAGYGLPTIYFMLQGTGVTIEHSRFGSQLGLGHGWRGWLYMAGFIVGPVFWLFHPPFISRVILPFMQAIRAL